jgi:hypothetical protein
MTIYATKYRPRETGMDETLSYGDVRVSYHSSTEPGVMLFARALIDAGHAADQELVILEATKEVRFPSLSLVASAREDLAKAVAEALEPEVAPVAVLRKKHFSRSEAVHEDETPAHTEVEYEEDPYDTFPESEEAEPITVQLSPAAYTALLGLTEGIAAWAGIAGRLKGRLRADGLVNDAHEVTAKGHAALGAYCPPVLNVGKVANVLAETPQDTAEPKALVLSDAAYAALVKLKRSPSAWVDLGGRLKGYLRANGLVNGEHEVTSVGEAAMADRERAKG